MCPTGICGEGIDMEISSNVTSLAGYLQYINEYNDGSSDMRFFFRGEPKSYGNTSFTPSVFRDGFEEHEKDIFYDALTLCSADFETGIKTGEILAKMQHYGVPTRLIDITSNPLVALYFACSSDKSKDGRVYIVEVRNNYVKNFDSDHVSLLANLARIGSDEREKIAEMFSFSSELFQRLINSDFKDKDDVCEFTNFVNKDTNAAIQKLLHEIRKEQPDFERIINPIDLIRDVVYIPRSNNARIIRQSGAFVLSSFAESGYGNGFCLRDENSLITVKAESKDEILNKLKALNISRSSLFPELYSVAEAIKEGYNLIEKQ
jgi:hypothetical protein